MKVFYSEHCQCADEELRLDGFEPEWLDDEKAAAYKHVDAEVRLQSGGSQRYWAFHVRGRHVLSVVLGD